ncbi:hypothetical protein D3C71_1904100 [compost metagenome]
MPAQGAGGNAQRRQGMAQVVLAVAVGALAVLPGFAPGDAGQAEEEAARRQGRRQLRGQGCRQFGADFQGVDIRRVVGQQRALLHRAGRQQQIGLGGM